MLLAEEGSSGLPLIPVLEYILKRPSRQTNMAGVESPSATQPFCVWAQASRTFAIHIPAEVIGSLGTESLVAFKRVPRRGLETGGILLGRTEFRDDTTTFWIEGFAPIESEHRFGPSYVLSDSDFAHLQTELTRNGVASLGIYRSQTRSEQLAIQDADVGLFEKCFGVSDNLFLMLAPVSRIGAFYFREDGNLKCVHQFTLVSSLSTLATHGRTSSSHVSLHAPSSEGVQTVHANIARRSADQAGALLVVNQSSDQEAIPGTVSTIHRGTGILPSKSSVTYRLWITETRRWATKLWSDSSGRSSGAKLRNWVLAAITLAVLTVNLLSYSFRRSAANPRAPNYLYLTVERAGPALRLLWDGKSSALRGATRAVLLIQDGDQQTDRELTPSEFMTGQFTYQPQHPAVTFRLNVYVGEPNAIGVVQVMFPPSPITEPPSIEPIPQTAKYGGPSLQPPVNASARAQEPVAQLAPTLQSPAPTAQFNDKPAPTAQFNDKKDQKDQNIEARPPAVRSADASGISTPAATSRQAAREPSLPIGFEESRQHSGAAEKNDIPTYGRELSVKALTTPVPSSRFGRLFGKIPLVGRMRKPAKAVEAFAVPVHQAQPIVRLPNDQQLTRPVAVGVKVYVGESGAVNNAEVVDYGDPLNLTLANAALAAARNWTFEPSRVDDIPVASQLIIRFYFNP